MIAQTSRGLQVDMCLGGHGPNDFENGPSRRSNTSTILRVMAAGPDGRHGAKQVVFEALEPECGCHHCSGYERGQEQDCHDGHLRVCSRGRADPSAPLRTSRRDAAVPEDAELFRIWPIHEGRGLPGSTSLRGVAAA